MLWSSILAVPAFHPMESNEDDEHDTCVPTVPVSGSVRESHGFRRLVLVSNTVDASRGAEVVGEDAQPAVSEAGGSESVSDTISVGASVGEAEVSETVVESPDCVRTRMRFRGSICKFGFSGFEVHFQ